MLKPAHFWEWITAQTEIDAEFGPCESGYALLNVPCNANADILSAQKELLLWHWKLGISMQRVQELMCIVKVKEPNGAISTMD